MNKSDLKRNAYMLKGSMSKKGYIRWWHSFSGTNDITGEKRTFFVEYFIINPALGSDRVIMGPRPSYGMIRAGAFPEADDMEGIELHSFYPVNRLMYASSPVHLELGDCMFSENRITGLVDTDDEYVMHSGLKSDSGYMEWDLEILKTISCHTGVLGSAFMSFINALDSFWHGEGIKTVYRGYVNLNGYKYTVSTSDSFGYADKHWGRSFNKPWMQLASCNLYSKGTDKLLKNAAFALDGCCPKLLCFPLRQKLILQLTYTGEDFDYSFANPLRFTKCKWKIKRGPAGHSWNIVARNKNSVINISGSIGRDKMTALHYQSPNGARYKKPVLAGGEGECTIKLFRRTAYGKKLIDTLEVKNALWIYK